MPFGGSQTHLKEDDAMPELKFLTKDIGDNSVADVTLSNVLVFITACHVISTVGFNKKIAISLKLKTTQPHLQCVA